MVHIHVIETLDTCKVRVVPDIQLWNSPDFVQTTSTNLLQSGAPGHEGHPLNNISQSPIQCMCNQRAAEASVILRGEEAID
jgi:hypothetical protein